MDRSDVQETLVSLYLRLNGYFVSGFIVHAPHRTRTEMDALAVRFPNHQEPEREVQSCEHLAIPANHIDFIVGEVKGGGSAVNFNSRFRENPAAIRTVLRRFGAFNETEITDVVSRVSDVLVPANLKRAPAFPELNLAVFQSDCGVAKLRFVPFAPEQSRPDAHARPYVFGDDMMTFVWRCFRPEQQRPMCDDHYNYELWGPQFTSMVDYFKQPTRHTAGTVADLYQEYGC